MSSVSAQAPFEEQFARGLGVSVFRQRFAPAAFHPIPGAPQVVDAAVAGHPTQQRDDVGPAIPAASGS